MNGYARLVGSWFLAGCGLLWAQSPDIAQSPPAGGASSPASNSGTQTSGGSKNGSFLGKDVPMLDPSKDMIIWDGKAFNVNDNRVCGRAWKNI
jgi:hypothetical protein